MKLLIFSDIHNDARALEKLMDIEADYYFSAGDLVNWARGLDAMGEILKRRADRMYVIPGNHESAHTSGPIGSVDGSGITRDSSRGTTTSTTR